MSKTFKQAPKPQPLADNVIAAFERGGTGQDTRSHISSKVEMRKPTNVEPLEPSNVGTVEPTKVETGEPSKVGRQEPTRRLSIDLPETWHRRFKTACTKTDKKMIDEVTNFIKLRTTQLEKE